MNTYVRKLAINDFVRRQTRDSEFSHFEGTLTRVLELAMEHWSGLDGQAVVSVIVPAAGFFCGVVRVTRSTQLESQLTRRQDIEERYISTLALGAQKVPGDETTLVFYSHAELAKKDEQTHEDAEYELVSINVEEEAGVRAPLHPLTMARNHLDKPGGTLRKYTADEFAESIDHWKDRVMNGGVR